MPDYKNTPERNLILDKHQKTFPQFIGRLEKHFAAEDKEKTYRIKNLQRTKKQFPKIFETAATFLCRYPHQLAGETAPGAFHSYRHIVSVLTICESTGRCLLLKRSPHKSDAGTWGVASGEAQLGETLAEATIRESREEKNYCLYDFRAIDTEITNDKLILKFISYCNHEFEPLLNDEHSDYQWVDFDDFPEKIQPGLLNLLIKKGEEIINLTQLKLWRHDIEKRQCDQDLNLNKS